MSTPGHSPLRNKRILLGVCGGIAVYKSPDLVRRLAERGADVQVVMTRGAAEFVTPLTFQAVSGRPVRGDLWDTQAEAAMGHIELARWADAVVVAPATANCLARLAHGEAGDLLTTLCLATEAPLLLAPAMNRIMWADAATQDNARVLADRGITLAGPGEGDQACGEVGAGRMLETIEIVAAVEAMLRAKRAGGVLAGRSVLVTAGPTREPLDPVRFLSNRSSGKMGFAVAQAAAAAGADVTLVAGPVGLATPDQVTRVDVETAQQMHDAVHQHVHDHDIFIAAAAVADYRPAAAAGDKIKKRGEMMSLELVRNPDILRTVAELKNGPFTVGFAAETNAVREHAQGKLQDKQLDMICANAVGRDSAGQMRGFDVDDNELLVLWPDGEQALPRASKTTLAHDIVKLIARQFAVATKRTR